MGEVTFIGGVYAPLFLFPSIIGLQNGSQLALRVCRNAWYDDASASQRNRTQISD